MNALELLYRQLMSGPKTYETGVLTGAVGAVTAMLFLTLIAIVIVRGWVNVEFHVVLRRERGLNDE